MENDKPKTPVSVRVTQILLLLTALYFSVPLVMTAIGYGRSDMISLLRFAFLFVLPSIIGLVSLSNGQRWTRRVATVALLSLWGFQWRVLDSFSFAFEHIGEMSWLFWGLILVIVSFIIGIPLLLLKLYRGKAEKEFFGPRVPEHENLSASDTRYLGEAVAGFDQSLFDREADLVV